MPFAAAGLVRLGSVADTHVLKEKLQLGTRRWDRFYHLQEGFRDERMLHSVVFS